MLYCVELNTIPETETSFPYLKIYSCHVILSRKVIKKKKEIKIENRPIFLNGYIWNSR